MESHTALELDPASVSIRRTAGLAYFYARRYPQARDHLIRAIAMNPTSEENYRILAIILAHLGLPEEAERTVREALASPGTGSYSTATLGYVLGRAGRRREAEAILGELTALAQREYVSPVSLATLHVGLGNVDAALDWAERAYEERRGWLAYFKVNPLLDPLRGQPRFETLVKRMRI
ncbi:MAG: hypothetical protein DMD29_03875 [Gemmatimonadetes bacterium]|nr:MAG: hypothetical protein DMD29_03875 [Gemmatimonadota bacterium]